jgi:hypothetical protein
MISDFLKGSLVLLPANNANVTVVFRKKLTLVFGGDQFIAKAAFCFHDSFSLF